MAEISSQLREVIENACATQVIGDSGVELKIVDRSLRWKSPFIAVNPERSEQDIEFIVDFELNRVRSVLPQFQSEYLTVTLYLVGGEAVPMPSESAPVGGRLAEIDRLNRDEPGVKFRFQPSDTPNGSWIVIESDIRTEGLRAETVTSALERLLECTEARYWEVYQWAVIPS